uniref:Secreted protein n=1 Tax=Steinernema glaseri TaxID=37863 RepID=A0A1I7YG75_9BILA
MVAIGIWALCGAYVLISLMWRDWCKRCKKERADAASIHPSLDMSGPVVMRPRIFDAEEEAMEDIPL